MIAADDVAAGRTWLCGSEHCVKRWKQRTLANPA
jgi:hypothetical protein